jgi:hypothetical protein
VTQSRWRQGYASIGKEVYLRKAIILQRVDMS